MSQGRTASLIFASTLLLGALGCGGSSRPSLPSGPRCGDGRITEGELCDGNALGSATCESEASASGTLACAPGCRAYDFSGCAAPTTCGNGSLDAGELCDGTIVGTATCEDQGLGAGTLLCSTNCLSFETRGCGAPDTCGNGAKDGAEVCDGGDLGGTVCADVGFDSGTLGCNANCSDYDTSGCERACEPRTCADVGAACGDVSDGCGGTLNCGACTAPLTCGGGGTANQCGAPCVSTCPSGWSCNNVGVCTGGDVGNVRLNEDAFSLNLSVTLNGAPYALISECDPASDAAGTVDIVHVESRAAVSLPLPCLASTPASAYLPAGTYQITVTGDGSDTNIPPMRTEVGTHTISADTNLTVNIDAVPVTANLTLNGSPYALISECDPASDNAGTMDWVRQDNGATVSVDLPCLAATPVSVYLPVGAYEVFVTGDGSDTDIPPLRTSVGVHNISGAGQLNFNIDAVRVTATLTLNNSPYALISECDPASDNAGTMDWVRQDTGATVSVDLPCLATTPVSVYLPVGAYEVFVTGDGSDTDIPPLRTSVGVHNISGAGQLNFNIDAVAFSLLVTLNGSPYALISECDPASDNAGTVQMVRADTGATLQADLPCIASTGISAFVPVGTYEIFATGDGSDTDIPPLRTSLGSHAINAAGNLTLNLQAFAISASLTLNNAPYQLISECDPASDDAGTMDFVRQDNGATMSIPVPCNASTGVNVYVPSGTYEIFVTGDGSDTLIPALRTSVGRYDLTANGNLSLNINAREVRLYLTLNGAPYQLISECDPASDDAGTMDLVRLDNGATLSAPLPCDSATPVTVYVPAGDYEVYVTGDGSDTQLPPLRTLVSRLAL